jgi:hypothetical protein
MQSIVLRIGIVGVIAVGGWLLRPFIMGDAGGLAVGDCFDQPTTIDETVDQVQHHPCTDLHGAEVIFVGDYAPVSGTAPTDEDYESFVFANCPPAFEAYSGRTWEEAIEFDMGYFVPTVEGWQSGDHEISCYVLHTDETQFTGSVKRQ